MKWGKASEETGGLPVKSWCGTVEPSAWEQVCHLARHPKLVGHVALMPDCHTGFGMPIGGVIAADNAVIPNAVGVDIGCGMGAVETTLSADDMSPEKLRKLLDSVKKRIPVGEGKSHSGEQQWDGFGNFLDQVGIVKRHLEQSGLPWLNHDNWRLDQANLGTLGGGNHFIEIQKDLHDRIWLMVHSGSRNLGNRIAQAYHRLAQIWDQQSGVSLPHRDLAFLPVDSSDGQSYLRDMQFAMAYAAENRKRLMDALKHELQRFFPQTEFGEEVNIHHNYAAREEHWGRPVWVHRKGATSAKNGETGIIPGSMGTPSYIVTGKGNAEALMSCSHGAGRCMSRNAACRRLTPEDCDQAMVGIVFDRWKHWRDRDGEYLWDLSEAPQAYKDIETVIASELDLVKPRVKLFPLGVIKG